MTDKEDEKKDFNFDLANLADQISCVGEIEHAYMHALKSASSLEEEDAVFYLTLADMLKQFRRDFMREHFPDVDEHDWCLLKALESIRQRVYESANTSYEDLRRTNDLWSMVMGHIFDVDMSGCISCREDRNEEAQK